jgi:SNF2 family DNA or RNA helicase
MARTYSSAEVKRLHRLYQELNAGFRQLDTLAERVRGEVHAACDRLAADNTTEILAAVPVDELNREKKGVRVKSLHDAGFHTIADLIKANPFQISAINGISPEGAQEIKKAAAEIAAAAQKGAKIRLSADERTPQSTALVTALYRYKQLVPAIQTTSQFRAYYDTPLSQAVAASKPATGGLRWMFASSASRASSDAACAALSQILSNENLAPVNEALKASQRLSYASEKEAWADFSRDSIAYINLLESLEPDRVGSGEAVYGLPEELAESVADINLDLTGLRCTLRRYQEWGVKYAVAQRRILLGDEMGLGKTVQAIAVMVHLRNQGAAHFVVVCPASVLTNWCREINKHSDLEVYKVHGSGKEAAFRQWVSQGGVAVTTYETTGALEIPVNLRLTMLTVDEAHYIKNPSAQRTVNVKRFCEKAERLLFMTGTALENRVGEMATLIQILNPQVSAQIRPMLSLSAAPQFREAVAPVYYRRKREDVLTELPELVESCEWCDLLPEEKRVYREAVEEQNFMAARRVSWNVDDLSRSCKAQRLLEIVEDAKEQERKVIVFSFFLDTISKLAALLGERCVEPITGSVSPARRQEIIDEFTKAPAGSVLPAQIQSGGTGLNIQTASVVILCEPQLKPSIENQAISRAYRMGQTRSVLVYRLLCDDTIDERIMNILAQKQKEFDAFADESKAADDTLELDKATIADIMQAEQAALSEQKTE